MVTTLTLHHAGQGRCNSLLQICAKNLLFFYSLPVAIRMPLGLASCTHATLQRCLCFPLLQACTSNVTTQSLNNSNTAYEIHCTHESSESDTEKSRA